MIAIIRRSTFDRNYPGPSVRMSICAGLFPKKQAKVQAKVKQTPVLLNLNLNLIFLALRDVSEINRVTLGGKSADGKG